jgi:hypothetical protein
MEWLPWARRHWSEACRRGAACTVGLRPYDQSLRPEVQEIARSRDSPAWDGAATVGAMKQKQFLIVATSGAGGDLQPLVAAA